MTRIDEKKLNPIPWNIDICYTNKNIAIYNLAIKNFCKKNNLSFIEIFDLLDDKDLADGLHPNSDGHEKMFVRVRDFLIENKII